MYVRGSEKQAQGKTLARQYLITSYHIVSYRIAPYRLPARDRVRSRQMRHEAYGVLRTMYDEQHNMYSRLLLWRPYRVSKVPSSDFQDLLVLVAISEHCHFQDDLFHLPCLRACLHAACQEP